MRTQDASPGRNRAGHLAGPILAWTVWAAMTVALVLYVRQDSRNVPFMDDFALVPMMTGQQPVSLEWAWSQHNEHRPLISQLRSWRGFPRFVANDFRTGDISTSGCCRPRRLRCSCWRGGSAGPPA